MPLSHRITIIVPCLNEAAHVPFLRQSLENQRLPKEIDLEILIADGGSRDGARELLGAWQKDNPAVTILDNPRAIVSSGLNQAILRARGETLIRMDVHTVYADDYVAECLKALRESKADNVGGPWVPSGRGYVSTAIALAFATPFVSGGAKSHRADYEGPVDSVYLGCWRRETFEKFGLFDEDLVRSQDNEHNLRIVRGGGVVYQTPRIRSWYTPRASLQGLFRQYRQYGYWKALVLKKHRLPANVRQLAPPCFVLAVALGAMVAPFSGAVAALLLAVVLAYATAALLAAVTCALSGGRLRYLPALPAVFAVYHFGFGLGYLRGILTHFVLKAKAPQRYRALTRQGTS